MRDGDYERSVLGPHAQGKEAAALLVAALLHLPLARRAPWFTAGVMLSIANYYRVHKRSHRDPAWARTHLPWHYDHHMGPDQHANWCVSHDWFDRILGTRKPWVGTPEEAAHLSEARPRPRRVAPAPPCPKPLGGKSDHRTGREPPAPVGVLTAATEIPVDRRGVNAVRSVHGSPRTARRR